MALWYRSFRMKGVNPVCEYYNVKCRNSLYNRVTKTCTCFVILCVYPMDSETDILERGFHYLEMCTSLHCRGNISVEWVFNGISKFCSGKKQLSKTNCTCVYTLSTERIKPTAITNMSIRISDRCEISACQKHAFNSNSIHM
jgi:hypothetical protein